ncbi:hypothetical protein C8J56DRAFT_1030456 [Mycena floridula]|nr:hypothetical protein C8J56DRAFT_1030456 [Mycena floridula]
MCLGRKRYLQRQWKARKPWLPRWDSLPNLKLHLISTTRPLFECRRDSCGFSYTPSLPICVFCRWTSTDAISEFERFDRHRRMSELALPTTRLSLGNLDDMKSSRHHHRHAIVVDLGPEFSAESPVSATPPRILRRKTRLATARQSAPPGTLSPIQFDDMTPLKAYVPITKFQTRSSFDGDRLGCPSRPYYTAIRKNMSSPSPSRAPSPTLSPPPDSSSLYSKEFFIDTSSALLSPPLFSGSTQSHSSPRSRLYGPFSGKSSGFSVSGETEMRMLLAKDTGRDHQNGSGYKFKETTPRNIVKRFRKSLISFLKKP